MADGFVPDDGFQPDEPDKPGAWDQAVNMVGRGAYALPGLVGLDYETVAAAVNAAGAPDFSQRFAQEKKRLLRSSRQVDATSPVVSGGVRGLAAAPGEALLLALAPGAKLAQGASAAQKFLTYGPRAGALTGLTEYGSTAYKPPLERASGAGVAGLAGTAIGGGAAAALPFPGGAPVAPSMAERLRSVATDQGRKVLTGNSAPMGTRKPLSEGAIRAAYDTKAIGPLTTVEKAAERLGVTREAIGQKYGDIIEALEARGVKGPNAILLARKLAAEADTIEVQSLGSPAPGMYRDVSLELQGLRQGMHGPTAGVPKVNPAPFADKRLALSQAEAMKRTLQRAAKGEYVKEGPQSLSGEAKTDLASIMRQAVEDAVEQQAGQAPAEAAAFVPVKRQLGAIIEASTAADRAAARAANRQTFGLGSKVMGAGALASGNLPAAIGTMIASKVLRDRGPSLVGYSAHKAANVLERPLLKAASKAQRSLTPEIEALVNYLRSQGRMGLTPVTADDQEPR